MPHPRVLIKNKLDLVEIKRKKGNKKGGKEERKEEKKERREN